MNQPGVAESRLSHWQGKFQAEKGPSTWQSVSIEALYLWNAKPLALGHPPKIKGVLIDGHGSGPLPPAKYITFRGEVNIISHKSNSV